MDDVREVFDSWKHHAGKNGRTHLDDKRIRLIRKALTRYSKADVLLAVRGWKASAHHRGENATGRVYNDLGLLLRDPEFTERFRDWGREQEAAERKSQEWQRQKREAMGY